MQHARCTMGKHHAHQPGVACSREQANESPVEDSALASLPVKLQNLQCVRYIWGNVGMGAAAAWLHEHHLAVGLHRACASR